MKADRLSDAEIIDHLEMGTVALRMARIEDLRSVADRIADVATVAADRLREFAGDRSLIALRDRASRLEDAAFHFQTCSVCKRQGEDFCSSGQRFAAYLRGEGEDSAPRLTGEPGPMLGKVRDVVLHADGRLTCSLEVNDAGAKFLEQIKGGRS
jgi:hypothetical protein